MKVYNKLVRDKIPEIILKNDGKICKTRILNDDEYLVLTEEKCRELRTSIINYYLHINSL